MSREQREAYGEGALALPNLRALGSGIPTALQSVDRVAALFYSALATIGLISAYDAYLVKVYKSFILDIERNPICAMLIRWDQQYLSYFVLAKATGTILVLLALTALFAWRRRLALPVASGVTIFQFALLVYLNTATH
jgi:hypothetical protein